MTVREFNPCEQYYGEGVVYKVDMAEFWNAVRFRVETTYGHSRPLYYQMPLFCIWVCMETAA